MAEARDLLRQKQTLGPTDGRPAPPVSNPAQPAAPAAAADNLEMPLYPGSRQTSQGPGQGGAGAGIAMALLETRDPVDAVIAFYAERLTTPGSKLLPARTEDRQGGHRVVRLSAGRENGGLVTVEARDEDGKTSIQLMNVKGGAGGAPPRNIPGLPSAAAGSDAHAALDGSHSSDPFTTDPGRPAIGGAHAGDPLQSEPARPAIGGTHARDPLLTEPAAPSRDLTVPSDSSRDLTVPASAPRLHASPARPR